MKIVMRPLDALGYVGRGKSKHRPRNAAHLYNGPYPFIQTSDVKNAGLYVTEYNQTYSAAGLAQSKLWKSGTLCITIAANIADTAILSFDACFPDSIIGFIPDPKKSDARYIKYLFDTVLQQLFKMFTQGVAQDNLSQEKLLSLKLPVAEDVNDQRIIADKIAIYESFIDINRRRIQLLEESARLLFREWFVYFRFPGHENVKIVDGIPEGWKKEKLINIGYLNYGKALVEATREEGDVKVYGSSGVVGVHSKSLVEGPGIIVGRKGNVGAVHWVNDGYWPIDTVYYIKREQSNLFLYLSLKTIGFINTDASVPGLNRDYAHGKTILVPTKDLLDKFLNQVNDIYSMVKVLTTQNQKLAQARDLLLPRLMSGAIEV